MFVLKLLVKCLQLNSCAMDWLAFLLANIFQKPNLRTKLVNSVKTTYKAELIACFVSVLKSRRFFFVVSKQSVPLGC